MLLTVIILVYLGGAVATFYSGVRWGGMDPDDSFDGSMVYWLAGTWFFSIPFMAVLVGVLWSVAQLTALAKSHAEKDKSDES